MPQVSLNIKWNIEQITAILLVLITIISGIIFYVEYQLGPMDYFSSQTVELEVSPGSSVIQIAKKLESSGLIRQSKYFTGLTRLMGVEGKLQAGYYSFTTDMSVKDIIKKMAAGRVATTKLTIPEGLTIEEMAPVIEEETGIEAEDFLQAAKSYNPEFTPENANVDYPVEGFLFPDTYQVPLNVDAEKLVEIMVDRFKNIVGLDSHVVDGRELSIYQIVTIASLLEEEAKLDVDRPKMSGVIYNRLDQGMRLQLCASVLYVMGVKKERLSLSDTKIPSPYNTYQNDGLPPGPISNPGLESIEAALNPADNDYLFYFSMPDGTTYYSENYKEHQRKVHKYLD